MGMSPTSTRSRRHGAEARESRKDEREPAERIEEPELRELAGVRKVRSCVAVRVEGGYELHVARHGTAAPATMYTQRGVPRVWASLDRLAQYVGRLGDVGELTVLLVDARRLDTRRSRAARP